MVTSPDLDRNSASFNLNSSSNYKNKMKVQVSNLLSNLLIVDWLRITFMFAHRRIQEP